MTDRRKVFLKADLAIPTIEHRLIDEKSVVLLDIVPPAVTSVVFPPETHHRIFDFAPWYNTGIDSITYACQRQIERFLAKQDREVASVTVVSYCRGGLARFLSYLVLLSAALRRELTFDDIRRDLMDGFIGSFEGENVSIITKKTQYHNTKAVLKALCERGIIRETCPTMPECVDSRSNGDCL